MKPIVFLESDYDCPDSRHAIEAAKLSLMHYFSIKTDAIKSMDVVFQYHMQKRSDIINLLFETDCYLASYSMYTQGSDHQFEEFVTMAGANWVKDRVYIDSSGELARCLDSKIRDYKHPLKAACGINSNRIYTIDSDRKPCRLTIDVKNYGETLVKTTPIEIID